MEMMVIQGVVAAETSRISNQGSPIIVVIVKITGLAVRIEPGLQLAFETAEQVVECVRITLLSDRKQLGDAVQLLSQKIGISGREVITLIDDSVKQALKCCGIVVCRPGQIWQHAIECIPGRE